MKIQSKTLFFYLSTLVAIQDGGSTPSSSPSIAVEAIQMKKQTHRFAFTHKKEEPTAVIATTKLLFGIRGGDDSDATIMDGSDQETQSQSQTQSTEEENEKSVEAVVEEEEEEESLEDRVHAAMRKLGLTAGNEGTIPEEAVASTAPSSEPLSSTETAETTTETTTTTESSSSSNQNINKEDIPTVTKRIIKEMDVDESIVIAAIYATLKHDTNNNATDDERVDEDAARKMIQNELNAIQRVMEDCDEVKLLVAEGHDQTLSRRALAFADMNIDIARAILTADEEDAQAEEDAAVAAMEKQRIAEEEQEGAKKFKNEMKTVSVDANFDPTRAGSSSSSAAATPATTKSSSNAGMQPPQGAPKSAKREDVIFQATSSNIHKLVLESPVPVLLDVYADWCGPCKALTPALEDMAIKAGGMFRLVKLNTDEERNISSALEVQSLPTVFGVRDGKIVHSFKGMPRSEDFMKNFMMGLFGASEFNPKVTAEEEEKYKELSNKLLKVAGASGFSFSQRERLQVRTNSKLDELVQVRGDMADAEDSAKVLRSLLSNVIRDPFDVKYRRVNLENKIIAQKIGAYAPAVSILKSVGFASDEGSPNNALIVGKGKNVISVAPFAVARDAIDKWIDFNRRAIATAARKKQDEIARAKLLEEAELVEEEDEEEKEEEKKVEVDPEQCLLKVRIEGKNKIHDVSLKAQDPLSKIIDALPIDISKDEEIQITCAARRLIVKSNDEDAMSKSMETHRLSPAASIVIRIINKTTSDEQNDSSSSSIKERAAARRLKKKGEHTMQSVGIYSKDDNNKAELIDGGGGVWYEHDVSDDEEEESNEANEEESNEANEEESNETNGEDENAETKKD